MTPAEKNRIVRGLVDELAARDPWERGHSDRVAVYAVATGERLGLSDARLIHLRYAATLHDVGKLSWVGSSPTREEIAQHPVAGFERLRKIAFLRTAAQIVRHHHERLEGSGYPLGLAGDEIPLEARIVATSEVLDVLLHGSPWTEASHDTGALRTPAFDQKVVDALLSVQRIIQPLGSK